MDQKLSYEQLVRDNRYLRELLAVQVAGNALYTDDGDLTDSSRTPMIDFANHTPEQIATALRRRAKLRAAIQTITRIPEPGDCLPSLPMSRERVISGELTAHEAHLLLARGIAIVACNGTILERGFDYRFYRHNNGTYPGCLRVVEPESVSPARMEAIGPRWRMLAHRDVIKSAGWWLNPDYEDFRYDSTVDIQDMKSHVHAHPTPELFRDQTLSVLFWTKYFKDQEDVSVFQNPDGDLGGPPVDRG